MNYNRSDFEQICRTCLTKAASMRNIKECILKDITLAQMITYCTSITTNKATFPTNICSDCEYQVSIAYKFKLKTVQVDMTLQQYLEEQSEEKPPDDNMLLDVESLKDVGCASEIYGTYVQDCAEDEQTTSEEPVYEDAKIEELCNVSDYDNCIEFASKVEIPEENCNEKKKLHVCTVCNKSYMQQAGLVWHMRIHTGERPFLCSHCEMLKTFYLVTVLVIQLVYTVDCHCQRTSWVQIYSNNRQYDNPFIECTGAHIMSISDINMGENYGNALYRYVSYSNSHIPKLSKEIINAFGNLHTLTINGSYLNTVEAGAFLSSSYLHAINLPYNNLTTLSSDTFKEKANLTTIDLSYNNIVNISKELFRDTHALIRLNLSHNALTLLEPDNFDTLVYLVYLNLSWNIISEVPTAHFGHQNNLLSLDLSHNRIAYLSIQSFIGLSSLTELNLSANRINSLQTNIFFNVQNLRKLDISENFIEYINANELMEATKLFQISFHSNKLRCSILTGLLKMFKSLNVNVTSGPEKEQLSIHGSRCNDTQDIFTTNNTETKSIDALEVFFAKDFKKSEFYKFFSTFNASSNSMDEEYVQRIVNDFVGIDDTHMVADHRQHVELIAKLFSIQMWLGSLFAILFLLLLVASVWSYIYFYGNSGVAKLKDLQLMESQSIV